MKGAQTYENQRAEAEQAELAGAKADGEAPAAGIPVRGSKKAGPDSPLR